jgi:hypothetical protein
MKFFAAADSLAVTQPPRHKVHQGNTKFILVYLFSLSDLRVLGAMVVQVKKPQGVTLRLYNSGDRI